jgi:hypothetical protein
LAFNKRLVFNRGVVPGFAPDLVEDSVVIGDKMKFVEDDVSMGKILLNGTAIAPERSMHTALIDAFCAGVNLSKNSVRVSLRRPCP